jgi:hypothetical protein
MTQELSIRAFFDQATNTVTYLVWDAKAQIAAVVDSVLDYDPTSGKVSASGADKVLRRRGRRETSDSVGARNAAHAEPEE